MSKWLLAMGVLLGVGSTAANVDAGWFGVGVNIGVPCYPRPYYGYGPYYYGYPYYAAPPVYVSPPPVVVGQPPVYVQPAPVVQSSQSSPGSGEPVPGPRPAVGVNQADINRHLQLLNETDERVRSDAAMDLGRLKAQNAVEVLCSVLANDKSALVRESAARALGLIASPRALGALQTAAQVDNDRDVRRSAQFSAEVIRANLR
jgi:hypothetical protein